MVFIITIIWRARIIRGVCVANSDLSKYACLSWQNVQSFPMALANIPIASKKVSTGRPLSIVTFLNAVSLVSGAWAGAAWPRRAAVLSTHTAAAAAAPTKSRVDRNLMSRLPHLVISLTGTPGGTGRARAFAHGRSCYGSYSRGWGPPRVRGQAAAG